MTEREPDWDTIAEQQAEARRDAMTYECPDNGQHCSHWHDGGKCCACKQAGPDWHDTGEEPF
jgi:hypothetical protein